VGGGSRLGVGGRWRHSQYLVFGTEYLEGKGKAPGLAGCFRMSRYLIPRPGYLRRAFGPAAYCSSTVAPAPSRTSLAFWPVSGSAPSRTLAGAPSTRSLASLRPRLLSERTSLITWIF